MNQASYLNKIFPLKCGRKQNRKVQRNVQNYLKKGTIRMEVRKMGNGL